jgi:hypothetical protein
MSHLSIVGNPAEEYLPSKYIPGGATYRARAVMEMPLSVEDAVWWQETPFP